MTIHRGQSESGYPLNLEQPSYLQVAVFGLSRLRDAMEDPATQDTTDKLVSSVMALCSELSSFSGDKVRQRTLVGMPKRHFWQRDIPDLCIAYDETPDPQGEHDYDFYAGSLAYARKEVSQAKFLRPGMKSLSSGIYWVKEGLFVHSFSHLPLIERQIIPTIACGNTRFISEIKPAIEIKPASEAETRDYLAMVHDYAAVNVPA